MKSLTEWMQAEFEAHTVQEVQLRHMRASARVVCTLQVKKRLPEALAEELETRAADDAADMQGTQTYEVHLLGVRSAGIASRIHRVMSDNVVAVDDLAVANASASEPATSTGVVAQLMRHNEAMARGNLALTKMLLEMSTKASVAALVRAEKAEARYEEAQTIAHKLLRGEREHEIALANDAHKQKLQLSAFEKVSALLPAVIQHISGGKLFAADSGGAGLAGVFQLVETLTMEQINHMMSALTPEQIPGFLELVKAAQAAANEREETAKPNPDRKAN